MRKPEVVQLILGDRKKQMPPHSSAKAFAPTNIALCKYWGKRDQEINLPVTSSLSVSLGNKGASTELAVSQGLHDSILLNKQSVELTSSFGRRLMEYLDLFRAQKDLHFHVTIESTVPIAAGLASSACGFASVIQALNNLFDWKLSAQELSILARLGSGSASRSIWQGFVEWHAGMQSDGMDSYAEPIQDAWPELCIGLCIVNHGEKKISSRDAMQRTVSSSELYSAWPAKVSQDLSAIKLAISLKDFSLLGKTAESNALSMHATMLGAWPPVCYMQPETLVAMQKVWALRQEGLQIYFTQDAGPNLKLLFLAKDISVIQENFSGVEVLKLF